MKMEWINNHTVLIVGLGLIGGSYAMALKRIGYHVTAIDIDSEAIKYATDSGIIDKGSTSPDKDLIGNADCIIMALYPSKLVGWISENQSAFKEGVIITDVTGIKSSVVYDIQKILRPDAEFIAAHPMAGREVYGVKNSDDKIFRDANFIVVPTDRNSKESVKWCEDLGRLLGFRRVSVLSPEEHDSMIAFVSQLTHCIAVSLMTCDDNEHLSEYTGDSFRDLTRIANINENMWPELFFMNKGPLLNRLDQFIDEINVIKEMIANEDDEGLKEKMRLSSKRRRNFDK
ncbi:MAG: prephenate dehydrogenase [Lachnospiraceae bacterium]|nr:prephenate dehydrogenase [Lachnospiraceae bacterium]